MINEQGLSGGSLRTGRGERIDLTGRRFGRLVVLGFVGTKYERRQNYWACVCDCGAFRETSTGALNSGTAHRCQQYCKGSAAIAAEKAKAYTPPPLPAPIPPHLSKAPKPCRACRHWGPLEGAELGGWCKAERFMSGKPWSGRCPFQAKGGPA